MGDVIEEPKMKIMNHKSKAHKKLIYLRLAHLMGETDNLYSICAETKIYQVVGKNYMYKYM